MAIRITRRVVAFRPRLSTLEERCTPTVNSLLVAGLAPGVNGWSTVSIGGVINDSIPDAINQGGLQATYQITDQAGMVLAAGPVELTAVPGYEHLSAFGITIPRSVAPGSLETITLFATDFGYYPEGGVQVESMGISQMSTGYESVSANLVIPRVKGTSSIGFGAWDNDLGTYCGSAQGKLSIKQKPGGGATVQGEGCLTVCSGTENEVLVGGRASGKFCFSYDTTGNVRASIKGSAVVTAATNDFTQTNAAIKAQDDSRIPTYRAAVTVKGELSLVRKSDSSICLAAKGSLGVKASGEFGRFCGTAKDMVIGIQTDAYGGVKLAISGKLNVKGNLQLGNVMPILG